MSGFEKPYTEEEYVDLWKKWSFNYELKLLYDKIEEKRKGKEIIFIYHSFGSFLSYLFFQLYPQVKVKGIIDLGGVPLRFYPLIEETLEMSKEADEDFIF